MLLEKAMAPLDCAMDQTLRMDAKKISYRFFTGKQAPLAVDLLFDRRTFKLDIPAQAPRPDWTRLGHHRCPNCTLPDDCAHCPAALGISMFLPTFKDAVSHDKAVVEVETGHRTIVAKTTLQTGLGSLIGLVCATSGCPLTRFLRPMARFHLPFASEEETLFRTFSIFLLGRYLESGGSGTVSVGVEGLRAHYADAEGVNRGMAERIRAAFSKDAVVNAIVILDIFAQAVPYVVDDALAELRYLYGLDRPQGP